MPRQERDIEAFKNFARSVIRTPQNDASYRNRFGRAYNAISSEGFTKEEINEILASGDVEAIRDLSRFFSRFSGIYDRAKQYYSSLLNYAYMLVPHYDLDNKPNVKKIKKQYKEMAKYVKSMNLDYILPQINKVIFQEGVYFGLLKETEQGRPVFYSLPAKYCRSRFNDENGLPVLELDCTYFSIVTTSEAERKAILSLFPKYVQTKANQRSLSPISYWVEIPPIDGGICFSFNKDYLPPLVSASGAVADLQTARDRETKKDSKALNKLLIQKLPIDKTDGELLFSLEEAEALHQGTCHMLAEEDTVNVLTTYAEVSLENIQDEESSSTASSNRITKYVDSVYDELGIAGEIFNPESGSTALTYSIKKDISIMFAWSKQYQVWLNAWLRAKAKNDNFYFTITFFPTTTIFQGEDADMYLKLAQYGYPKNLVASAIGIEMTDLLQMSHFENDVWKMTELMVPLQSSYTTPGDEEKKSNSSEKSSSTTKSSPDLSNEGGRPEKSITQRSDKTVRNRDGAT